MTSNRLDDSAECPAARVTVGGPRAAVLATRGATCVGYPTSSPGPLFWILSSVRQSTDARPPGITEIIILISATLKDRRVICVLCPRGNLFNATHYHLCFKI